jgi:phage terminase large subunit-like protein
MIECDVCGADLGDRPPWICKACKRELRGPNPGPQSEFVACMADVVAYGGAAGGGKSDGLLLVMLVRALEHPGWNGLICRNRAKDLTLGKNSLWGSARRVFEGTGATFREGAQLDVRWPNGSCISFRHLDDFSYENFRGPGFDGVGIDEAVEVDIEPITFLFSRMRSTSGCRPQMWMTMNPDPDHPIAEWIEWYLRSPGVPDREKSGRVRWMLRSEKTDKFVFGSTPDEAAALAGRPAALAKSFTFISSKLEDNPAITDPQNYRANLAMQDEVGRARLEDGNWWVHRSTGSAFERARWRFVSEPLAPILQRVRAWDKAASRPDLNRRGAEDPDFTAGPLLLFDACGRVYLAGLTVCREETGIRDRRIAETVAADGANTLQVMKQGPSDTGKSDVRYNAPVLAANGADVRVVLERTNKLVRSEPLARALEFGMKDGRPRRPDEPLLPGEVFEPRCFILTGEVRDAAGNILEAGWLAAPYHDAGSHPATVGGVLWSQLNQFPNADHDDILDAMFDAFEAGTLAPGRQVTAGQRGSRYASGR